MEPYTTEAVSRKDKYSVALIPHGIKFAEELFNHSLLSGNCEYFPCNPAKTVCKLQIFPVMRCGLMKRITAIVGAFALCK